jgi:hypothetical protein
MNEFANYANDAWGREASIKVHCSTGQFCPEFPDPVTNQPINFNFLPYYASPKLGIILVIRTVLVINLSILC